MFRALFTLSSHSKQRCFFLKSTIITVMLAVLVSCSSNDKQTQALRTERALYETSQRAIKNKDYVLATTILQRIESDFPFGKYANSAQLSLIYVYFKTQDIELADAAASRFIRLHPNHPDVDYAYYMRGLIAFPKEGSIFQTLFKADQATKNVKDAQLAFVQFSELVNRFPESQYTADALKRLEYLRNLLARSEINIANYYLNRKAYIAAVNRGKYVIENFQRTPAVPDALAIMIQSYTGLGMDSLAADNLTILKKNFPEYPALNNDGTFDFSYYKKDTRSILGLLTFGVIDFSRPPSFDTRAQYGEF